MKKEKKDAVTVSKKKLDEDRMWELWASAFSKTRK